MIDLPPGPAEITARAWDTAAESQPSSAAERWNPKGYVNNSGPASGWTSADASRPAHPGPDGGQQRPDGQSTAAIAGCGPPAASGGVSCAVTLALNVTLAVAAIRFGAGGPGQSMRGGGAGE